MDSRLSHATSERQNLMQPGLTGVTSSPALEGHSQRKSQPLSPLRTAAACDIDRGRAPSTACQPELAPWRGWISCSAQPLSRPEHTAQHPPYPPCARDLPLLRFASISSHPCRFQLTLASPLRTRRQRTRGSTSARDIPRLRPRVRSLTIPTTTYTRPTRYCRDSKFIRKA